MRPTLNRICLPGRVRLEYVEQGSGTPVIALHGVTDSWRSFEPVLRYLPPGLRLIALSQRGHGDSDKPASGYAPADFAADVAAFMDALRIEAFARAFQQGTLAQPIDALLLDRFVAESLKVPAHVWRAAFAGFIGDDFSARLREIDVPTLLVRGRHDAFCPAAEQQRMLRLISTARLVEYADAGHAMHWEEPRRFALDLSRFATSVAAHAATA